MYVPHVTIGYDEESKLNVKPLVEKYLSLRYLQESAMKEIEGGLLAVQLAEETFLIKKSTRCPA